MYNTLGGKTDTQALVRGFKAYLDTFDLPRELENVVSLPLEKTTGRWMQQGSEQCKVSRTINIKGFQEHCAIQTCLAGASG